MKTIAATVLLFWTLPVWSFGPKSKRANLSHDQRTPVQWKPAAAEERSGLSKESHHPADETMDALKRLLERQQEDMDTTKELLESLEKAKTSNTHQEIEDSELSLAYLRGYDYGFVSRSDKASHSELNGDLPGYGPPANVWTLGWGQFWRNLDAMMGEYKDEEDIELTPEQTEYRTKLESLTLDSNAIWEREEKAGNEGPLIIQIPYLVLCWLLDVLFEGKNPFSRFFFLETVARMPYFSYISMIHLYETLGFWRRSSEVKRIHFAEELNEFRHLMIAESLGGDQQWWVRFMASHSAILYYWVLNFLWLVSPSLSYEFSRLLETHAVNTYGQFLDENEELLKSLPPPVAAVEYYTLGLSDPFYAEFQIATVANGGELRRPGQKMHNLYNVFEAIQADEGDHVSAMQACLDPQVPLISPSIERRFLTAAALAAVTGGVIAVNGGLPTGLEDLALGDVFDAMLAGGAAVVGAISSGGEAAQEVADGVEGGMEGAELFAGGVALENTVSAFANILGAVAGTVGFSKLVGGDRVHNDTNMTAEEEDDSETEQSP